MKKLFLITAIMAALPTIAHAGLQVSATDADIGTRCYSDEPYSTGVKYTLYATTAPAGFFVDEYDLPPEDQCADTYDEQSDKNDENCWVGISGNTLYHCYPPIDNPSICAGRSSSWNNDIPPIDSWTACGNNRVRRGYITDMEKPTGNYTCEIIYDYSSMDYACAAGYYVSSGTDQNIICEQCPPSGGIAGHSEIGNTDITGCYIPANNPFSDETGSGTIQGNKCYWKK